ncbi:NADPH:quinone reductase domain protein [Dictyocaulus viviparus]|uniref:NADPH:quinone reductase domain protein n=1 Tax=Dictyocaulus viviparus TaxID=29172 RepID=A0A0D8Y6G4_DICVI|nr:NADPH:quinone reductase domain protein [Dictyocaulus viviparus]
MATEYGSIVVGTAGTEEGVKLVQKNGASKVFNHRATGYVDEIIKEYPEGFDLIVEMFAHLNLANDLKLLAPRGQVAIVGSRGETNINPRWLMKEENRIFGVMLSKSTTDDWAASSSSISKFFCTSRFRPVIARVYPLMSLSSAHIDIMDNKGAKGKLIISVNDQL